MNFPIKTPTLTALFALLAAGPALAGASSENQIDPRALEGPGGQQSHSTDPGNTIQGSPGPAGPSNPQDLNKGETAGGAATGAGSGTSGSSTVPADGKAPVQQPKPAQ